MRHSTTEALRAAHPGGLVLVSRTTNDQLQALTELVRVRYRRIWEDAHLPIFASLLGYDVVLLLAQLYLQARTVSLKEIYLSLPYSENAVRFHIQKLQRCGWIELKSAADRRFRNVQPTAKFQEALHEYLELLRDSVAGERLPANDAVGSPAMEGRRAFEAEGL
jgi:biotin operon repressor